MNDSREELFAPDAESKEAAAEPLRDKPPVGPAEIAAATQTLLQYKAGKAQLEKRLIENQQWYKLRQWECMRRGEKNAVEPASAWLLNAIANKHAEAMDNLPAANILPREEGDREEAARLRSILPVILAQCDFEQVYSDEQSDKIESGTGVYGVFWDASRHNGLGDVRISCVDLIDLFWEPGITELQESRNVFHVTLMDNDLLETDYPRLSGCLGAPGLDVRRYVYDDAVDTSGKSAVVDWYYKKKSGGKTLLHYCKFVVGQPEPLFATENEEAYAQRGWYDHGQYPFVFDRLLRCKGTPTGFGFIDIGKSAQEYIDRGDQAILQNLLFNARPRHFIRSDGAVNEEEFADATQPFVHVDGHLGADSIQPVPANPLSSLYVQILESKVQELKETTGNRDVTNGGSTGGVTAASAIAAMQEAGGRLARDSNKGSYRAFRKLVLLVIELIRQFYDLPRQFRILGRGGAESFVAFSNAALRPQPQGTLVDGVPMAAGVEVGYRLPVFDIEVTAEKQSPYTRMAQNELALQLYGAGFFAPENAEQALACLEMMDFDRRDEVVRIVRRGRTLTQTVQSLRQMALQMAGALDATQGTSLSEQLERQFGAQPETVGGASPPVRELRAPGALPARESGVTARARQRAAEVSAPR